MLRLIRYLVQLGWPMRVLGPLIGRFNPFHPDRRRDPYPAYRALRERHPVYRSPMLRLWVLTRYADVTAVLRDPRFSVVRTESNLASGINLFKGLRPDFIEMITRNLLMLDPPDHTRIRNLVNKAFTPRRVGALRPRIQEIADDLFDRAEPAGEMEVVRDLAYRLPITVIAEMLGVPTSDAHLFRKWSDDLTALLDPFTSPGGMAAADDSFAELSAYFHTVIAERRRRPRDDLISALVAAEESGDALSEAELLSTCGVILGAGHETTKNLIANAVLALLRHPGERKRLLDDPSLVPNAVDEFLRFDPPVQFTDRVAKQDCEIGGKRIRGGEVVGLLLGAANRDPEAFPDPDRLDVGRTGNRHLSLSHGIHFCVGAPLARLEAEVALETLLRRFPHFTGDPEPTAWQPSVALRGPTTLPIQLRPNPST